MLHFVLFCFQVLWIPGDHPGNLLNKQLILKLHLNLVIWVLQPSGIVTLGFNVWLRWLTLSSHSWWQVGKLSSIAQGHMFLNPLALFLLRFFFLMWTIVKVFIEFVIILLLLYVFVFWPGGTRDLSSSTKNQTHTLCIGRWSINHWSTMEVPTLALEFLSRAHASSPFCLNASKATSLSFPQCHQSRLSVWLAVY